MKWKLFFLFGLTWVLSLTSCYAVLPEYFYIKGSIQDGKYVAPSLFTLDLPSFLVKPGISEKVLEDSKEIILNDFSGTLFRITYIEMDEEIQKILIERKAMTEHPKLIRIMMRGMFEDTTFPSYLTLFPDAQVLEKKELTLDDGKPAFFALVLLPKGSLLTDEETRATFDVTRSFLYFPIENNFIFLSHQCDLASLLRKQLGTGDGLSEEEHLKLLLKAANSCKAEPKVAKPIVFEKKWGLKPKAKTI